ncbi:MAG: aldehyde dehydrogenase family protein, partial [Aurantimicrobium sp.]
MNFPTKTVQEWADYASSIKWPEAMIIDGQAQAGRDDSYVPLVTPRDGSVVTQVPYATSHELEQAVSAARRAFDEGPWPRMAPKQRKEL